VEFSHRKHIAEVGWSTICNGELVDGDTLILMVANLINVFLAGWLQNLLSPDSLDGTRVWIIWVVLEVKKYPSVSLDEFAVL
jgi:hypothetical protein